MRLHDDPRTCAMNSRLPGATRASRQVGDRLLSQIPYVAPRVLRVPIQRIFLGYELGLSGVKNLDHVVNLNPAQLVPIDVNVLDDVRNAHDVPSSGSVL